jgi:hypothetical protein
MVDSAGLVNFALCREPDVCCNVFRVATPAGQSMRKADEYRANAAECQRKADATRNQDEKEAWLRVAQAWLRLIRVHEQTEADILDPEIRARTRVRTDPTPPSRQDGPIRH